MQQQKRSNILILDGLTYWNSDDLLRMTGRHLHVNERRQENAAEERHRSHCSSVQILDSLFRRPQVYSLRVLNIEDWTLLVAHFSLEAKLEFCVRQS